MTSVDIKLSFKYTVLMNMISVLQMREPNMGARINWLRSYPSGGPGLGCSNFHVSRMEGFLLERAR